jgi:Tfp pilus assembly protein PilX
MNARPHLSRRPGARAAERGSAYLFVLFGLLVLTIIGLSLVVVTQTEVQIGGAEKSATRVLFAAESGLHAQVGLHFLQLAPSDNQFVLDTTTAQETAAPVEDVVDVSPFYPIYAGPCAICSVNQGSEQRYYVNNFAVNSRGRRYRDNEPDEVGVFACEETPQASKLLSAMYMIQPEPRPGGGVTQALREYDPTAISTDTCPKGLTDVIY